MNKNEAKKIIEYVFTHKFEESFFEKFISNVFKGFEPVKFKRAIKHAFEPQVVDYNIIGTYTDAENNIVDILQVTLKNKEILQRARTLQRNFVADYLSFYNKSAAIVAFTVKGQDEWRFSLVKLDHSLQIVEDKLKTKKEITPARRWSFLVGKDEGSHTAQSRFIKLLTSDEKPNLAELELAFDIESVTKEFFDRYTELFFGLQKHLEKIIESDETIKKDFEEKEISTVDFAKKTLGQIVFLYFLQKKGWFGVSSDREWGTGPKSFLREVFNRREKYGENFFNDILEPLFYEGLAQDRGESAIYTRLNNVRMPFLNGGLFEPMNNYKWEETDITLPDELFSNDVIDTKTGDVGTGILDVFDRYNFTVNENEPLEQEVAVDPEMLGKVFENLLEIKDRKSKGAFYTPREIVHYMCQETLINYLETETENIDKSDIEFFIRQGELILENDKTTADKIAEKEDKGYKYKGEYTYLLPQSIIGNAPLIDKLLYNIKVADPAVGSGAFPLGMLNEIVRARCVIGVHTKDNKKVYTLKKETISNSLYGVDIDPGAVEIAKLRLWLSLVVDENVPHPLPNLDHKIMQGNSLISEYEGIKLFDDSIFSAEHNKAGENKEVHRRLTEIGKETIALANQNIFSGEKLEDLKKEAKSLNKDLKKNSQDNIQAPESRSLFDEPEQINILEEKTKELTEKTERYVGESHRSDKQSLKRDIDELKWDIIEMTLRQQGQEDKIEDLQKLRKKNIKPFFIWKLEFADVFKKNGGFDVVIGNPPYLKERDNELVFRDVNESNMGKQWHQGKMDFWFYFLHLSIDLINNNRSIAFITPRYWINSKGASRLIDRVEKELRFIDFLDIGKLKVFDNVVGHHMVAIYSNNLNIDKFRYKKVTNNLNDIGLNKNTENIEIKYLNNSELIQDSEIILDALSFEENNCESLGNFFDVSQGVVEAPDKVNKKNILKTNHKNDMDIGDGIFVLTKEEIEKLELSEAESQIIKTYASLSNISRYHISEKNIEYLIYSDKITKEYIEGKVDFIKIKNHLDKYSDIITSSNKPYGLHRPRKSNFFIKNKIIFKGMFKTPEFALDNTDMYFGMSMLSIIKKDDQDFDLKYLLAILNSTFACSWFYSYGKKRGIGVDIGVGKLRSFPIKIASKKIQDSLIELVDQILDITSSDDYDPKNPPKKQKQIETKIDEMVMDLYELTEEEKEIIRNN